MIWAKFPLLFAEVRPFQVVGLLLILYSLFNENIRKEFFRITSNHTYMFLSVIAWGILCLASTTMIKTAWSTIDIIKSLVYFIFAICLSAAIIDLKNNGRDLNFIIAGYLQILGMLITLVFFVDIGIKDFFSLIIMSLANGNPDIIIFKLFGKSGLFGEQGIEEAAGLRHTFSMSLTVTLFFVLDYKRNETPSFNKVFLSALILFFIASFQSRSAWMGVTFGFTLIAIHSFKPHRIKMKTAIFFLTSLPAILYAAYFLSDAIINRLDNHSSVGSRISYMNHAIKLIQENPWGVDSNVVIEQYQSPHNFILDTGLTGGYMGMIAAASMILSLLILLISISKSRQSAYLAAALFALIARYFTAGSGLPGMGEFIGISAALQAQNRKNDRTLLPYNPTNNQTE